MDILYPEIAGSNDYDGLPDEAKEFVAKIEKEIGLPVTFVGKCRIDVLYTGSL